MTFAEFNYAQIEKEMLAIVFACTKFHQYGKLSVDVPTDHKPMESIKKPLICKVPPRRQRMMRQLQPYDLCVHCLLGKFMLRVPYPEHRPIQG